ncbi:MAG: hypothetical protein QG656_1546 [Candidatus Hydrogenedentes bacterium]|nr:hypothetical protein [Candidatus Hydrogenedentota bacterium]
MLKLGLIGAGAIMQWGHSPGLVNKKDVEVAAIADPSEANRTQIGERLGCANLFADYRAVLDDPAIQAVDICLPHHLHEAATLAAFDAGKDVLIEKPIALTLDEADRMIAAAKEKNRKFFVSLNQRFEPCHRKFKEILDSGQYGKPFLGLMPVIGDEFARMNVKDSWKGRWDQAGGGALGDTGTHMFYLILWWFGRPKTVSCQWGRFMVEHDCKADDNAIVTLGYDGMLINIAITYTALSDPWTERKQFYFPGHSVHITMDPAQPIFHGAGKQSLEPIPMPPMPAGWAGNVAASVSHFLDCIQGKAEPEFGPEAARETLEMILLAYKAAEEGRTLAVPQKA